MNPRHSLARLGCALILLSFACLPAQAQTPIKIFAAGSLTGALTAVAKAYTAKTGTPVESAFGPAGLMRERIENGDKVDIFASANMEHPQALADKGRATQPVVFVRNRLCAKALPEFGLTTENFLDRLLDPSVGLGTSTPKADPGGDYTWMLFAKADKLRPGAKAILEAKAQQLVGGKNNPPVPEGQNAMMYFFAQKKIQMTLGYCSSRQTKPDPNFSSVELPAAVAVIANYGVSVLSHGNDAAYRLVLFMLSPEAQKIFAQYGFTPVSVPVDN